MGASGERERLAELEEENARLREIIEKMRTPARLFDGFSPAQNKLLAVMMNCEGIVARYRLYDALYWDRPDGGPDMKNIDVLICQLRPKLRRMGVTIKTEWGVGYSLTPEGRQILKDASTSVKAIGMNPNDPYSMQEIIFGIGLPRTGTRSLTAAMTALGYRSQHYFDQQQWSSLVMRQEPQIDFACDLPVPIFMDDLAASFPNARFIFTDRGLDTWGPSMRALLSRNGWGRSSEWARWRELLLGREDNLPHLLRVFSNYREKAKNLSASRDVLFMDIEKGDGWEPLCEWLGAPIPNAPFPKVGVRSETAHSSK